MEYDAITLDANIFIHNGLYLEGGMLQQLHQFKEGTVQFVSEPDSKGHARRASLRRARLMAAMVTKAARVVARFS